MTGCHCMRSGCLEGLVPVFARCSSGTKELKPEESHGLLPDIRSGWTSICSSRMAYASRCSPRPAKTLFRIDAVILSIKSPANQSNLISDFAVLGQTAPLAPFSMASKKPSI